MKKRIAILVVSVVAFSSGLVFAMTPEDTEEKISPATLIISKEKEPNKEELLKKLVDLKKRQDREQKFNTALWFTFLCRHKLSPGGIIIKNTPEKHPIIQSNELLLNLREEIRKTEVILAGFTTSEIASLTTSEKKSSY